MFLAGYGCFNPCAPVLWLRYMNVDDPKGSNECGQVTKSANCLAGRRLALGKIMGRQLKPLFNWKTCDSFGIGTNPMYAAAVQVAKSKCLGR